MKKPKTYVGGQAVIEGVMMRGPVSIATAVRTPSGEITVKKDAVHSITERYPILKKPFLRGSVALCESLVYGMKSLSYSAQAAGEEDEQLSDKPDVRVEFTRNTEKSGQVAIEYYKYDNNFYIAITNNDERFLVNRKDVETLIKQIELY